MEPIEITNENFQPEVVESDTDGDYSGASTASFVFVRTLMA